MIDEPRNQRTIGRPATVEGFGYWSGRDIRVEFRPSEPNTGIVFIRGDLQPQKRIAAVVENRIEVPRRTNLIQNGATVEMVEHVLAALAGLRIDNCEVWVNAVEMPGCDGSSAAFVAALDKAGIEEQSAIRPRVVIGELARVGDDETWVEARPSADNEMSVHCHIDYSEQPAIGRQTVELAVTPASFRGELASARTFILKEEADWLVSQGLCQRASVTDLLVFDEAGPIENELRYPDECVRHKALDLVGDLALIGCDLVGHFVANRSGHRLNADLVRAILSQNGTERMLLRSA